MSNDKNIKEGLYKLLQGWVTLEIDWRGYEGKGRRGYVFGTVPLSILEKRAVMKGVKIKNIARQLRCSDRQARRCLKTLEAEKKLGSQKVTWGIKLWLTDSHKWEGTGRDFCWDGDRLMPGCSAAYDTYMRVINNPSKYKRRSWSKEKRH